jgi:hypothetical protein
MVGRLGAWGAGGGGGGVASHKRKEKENGQVQTTTKFLIDHQEVTTTLPYNSLWGLSWLGY